MGDWQSPGLALLISEDSQQYIHFLGQFRLTISLLVAVLVDVNLHPSWTQSCVLNLLLKFSFLGCGNGRTRSFLSYLFCFGQT